MALKTYLLDKSALARAVNPLVRERLLSIRDNSSLATCSITDLEILFSARSPSYYQTTQESLGLAYKTLIINQQVMDRAIEVQGLLARKSQHRGASIPDLVIAATAEQHGAIVLHYDHDYELIASVTNQPVEWIVAPGSD